MARPKGTSRVKITPEHIKMIEKRVSEGDSLEAIAAEEFDCTRDTLRLHAKAEEPVSKAIEKGKQKLRSKLKKSAVQRALEGNTAMHIFLLKTMCGMRENDAIDINMKADINTTNHAERIDKMSNDQLIQYITNLVKQRSKQKAG